MRIRIAGITEESIVDGPGLRMTVFVQGCPHGCKGCHNPETHDFNGGWDVYTSDIIGMMDSNPLLDGITLSGGEPFCQAAACIELADAAHKRGLNVWCYTGYTWGDIMQGRDPGKRALLRHIDVLVDGPFHIGLRTLELPWRGSANQRLIDVEKTLQKRKIEEYKHRTSDEDTFHQLVTHWRPSPSPVQNGGDTIESKGLSAATQEARQADRE